MCSMTQYFTVNAPKPISITPPLDTTPDEPPAWRPTANTAESGAHLEESNPDESDM